ncbi:MAG: YjfB family protein [Sporomusaceae bacterium]|jgi:hypothetical protein|nr:YjfB family protein [Sporomusaceae bacterium]
MVSQIANTATALSQISVQQEIGVSILKKAMDTTSNQAQELVQMMAASQPHLGGNVDISA